MSSGLPSSYCISVDGPPLTLWDASPSGNLWWKDKQRRVGGNKPRLQLHCHCQWAVSMKQSSLTQSGTFLTRGLCELAVVSPSVHAMYIHHLTLSPTYTVQLCFTQQSCMQQNVFHTTLLHATCPLWRIMANAARIGACGIVIAILLLMSCWGWWDPTSPTKTPTCGRQYPQERD